MLLIKVSNNGYGCSCCADFWKNYEWVEKKEFPKEKILKIALEARKNMNEDHLVEMRLEDNGKILYGFRADVCRMGERLYWIEGEKESLLKDLKEKA